MRRTIALAAALTMVVIAALGLTRSAGAAVPHRHVGQDYPPRPGGTAVFVIGIPTAPPGPPPVGRTKVLTKAQRRDVREIALRDPLVKRLVRGKHYRMLGTLSWILRGKLVGGVAQLGFSPAVTLSGTWLSWGTTVKATYHSVSRVSIYVDLSARKVVAIFPR